MKHKISVKEDDRIEIEIDGHSFTAVAQEWFFAIDIHRQYMQAIQDEAKRQTGRKDDEAM